MACASIAYSLVSLFAAERFFRKGRARHDSSRPPVTVLVPLCGADFKALENYVSLCRQDYPDYQILFGVQDPNDSSIPVVKKLIEEHPHRDTELVVSAGSIGENPKVNNLNNMLDRARYETLVIVDSDIRVAEDFLATVAPPLEAESIGLATCFYRAGEAPGLAARLEAVGITGEFAPGVLTAHMLEGMSFALGATMALKKRTLREIGGFEAIADHLADDYMLGNLIWKAGRKVLLLPYVVETVLSPLSFTGMLRHQIRWARGIRACRPMGHLGSVVTYGVMPALLCVLVSGFSAWSLVLLALTLAGRLCVAWRIGAFHLGDRILADYMALVPIRDLLSFFVWSMALVGKRVEWRGRTFELQPDGKIVPVR